MSASSAVMPPAVGGMPQQGAGIRQVRNFAQDNGLGRNFVQDFMANRPAGQMAPPQGTGIRQMREYAQDNGLGRNFVQQQMNPQPQPQPVNMGPQANPFQGQQSMGIQPGSFGTPGVRQVMRPTSPMGMKGGASAQPPAIRR